MTVPDLPGSSSPLHRVVNELTEDTASSLVDAFRAVCTRRSLSLAVAVVDRGGHLIACTRRDGAQIGAVPLAVDKAFTAVAFGAPSSRWAGASAPGATDWGLAGSLGGRVQVMPGGVPLFSGGQLVGGLGISGAAGLIDEECAFETVAAVGLRTSP